VRLREPQDERIFQGSLRLERFAKSAENFLVHTPVFLAEEKKSRGCQAVPKAVEAAALFPGPGLRSAEMSIAPVCFTLSF
jgi:hypothetical protein